MKPTTESTEGDRPRDHVGSLDKGLAVLSILAANPGGLTLTQMGERADLTRAGARRLLLTLVTSGFARQDGRLFLLTPRLLSLARTWLDGVSLWEFALPHMRKVAGEIRESCSAAVLSDTDIYYVARVPGERIMSVTLNVGTRLPAYCTAMGRVLLAGLGEDQLAQVLSRSDLVAKTPKTVIDPDALAAVVAEVARQGFALVDEELELGLRSIAVPVRDRSHRVIGAINVSAQSARYAPEQLVTTALPLLREAAQAIEHFFAVQ